MTAPAAAAPPGRLRRAAIALGCVLLTALFTFVLFPWQRLGPWVSQAIGAGSGAEVTIRDTHGGLGWLGPQLRLEGLSLHWPDGRKLQLDSGTVRPALSFSWLRGAAALAVAARGPDLRGSGTFWPGRPAFTGQFETSDAGVLLASWIPPGGPLLSGSLRARLELAAGAAPGPPTGTIQLQGRDGSVALPGLPMALPYQTLTGKLRLEPGRPLRIDELQLAGPLLSLDASGTVFLRSDAASSPLNLQVSLHGVDRALARPLSALGIRLGPDGSGQVRLGGTLGAPAVR